MDEKSLNGNQNVKRQPAPKIVTEFGVGEGRAKIYGRDVLVVEAFATDDDKLQAALHFAGLEPASAPASRDDGDHHRVGFRCVNDSAAF